MKNTLKLVWLSTLLMAMLFVFGIQTAMAYSPRSAESIEELQMLGLDDEEIAYAYRMGNHKIAPNIVLEQRDPSEPGGAPSGQIGDTHYAAVPSMGNIDILVLMIDFPGNRGDADAVTNTRALMFGNGLRGSDGKILNQPYESLKNYYARSSYNKLII
ncbi:MAG: hypothetical protein LBH54_04870, partial [Clostridiales bacterium]|nr:hypothetical protein [Clostridiales bacterium]